MNVDHGRAWRCSLVGASHFRLSTSRNGLYAALAEGRRRRRHELIPAMSLAVKSSAWSTQKRVAPRGTIRGATTVAHHAETPTALSARTEFCAIGRHEPQLTPPSRNISHLCIRSQSGRTALLPRKRNNAARFLRSRHRTFLALTRRAESPSHDVAHFGRRDR